MEFFKQFFEMIEFQSKYTLPQTQKTFKALVEAVIPKTPELTEKDRSIQSFGALDLHTDEFLIWILNHHLSLKIIIKKFNINLANATAEMFNIAAKHLVDTEGNKNPVNLDILPEEGIFAALEVSDRIRALNLLEELQIDLASLPIPFHNNQGFVLAIISVIILLISFGYYSEWSAYDSTRLETPQKRIVEQFPIGWKQVGYPGSSMGYHAFRGFLVQKFTD